MASPPLDVAIHKGAEYKLSGTIARSFIDSVHKQERKTRKTRPLQVRNRFSCWTAPFEFPAVVHTETRLTACLRNACLCSPCLLMNLQEILSPLQCDCDTRNLSTFQLYCHFSFPNTSLPSSCVTKRHNRGNRCTSANSSRKPHKEHSKTESRPTSRPSSLR